MLLAGDVAGLRLRSTLARGTEQGGVRLILDGSHRLVEGTLGTDNRLSPANGGWRFSASLALNSAAGWGEQIYGSAIGSDHLGDALQGMSPLRIFGVGAVIPIGIDGLTLNPEYTLSQTRPIPEPGVLETADRFERFAFRVAYPVVRTHAHSARIQVAYEHIDQVSRAVDFDVEVSHDRYSAVRAGVESSWLTRWGAHLGLSATASFGLGGRDRADAAASGVPLSRQDAGPHFSKAVIDGRYLQPLPHGFQFDVVARAQTSFGDALLKPEQLSLDSHDIVSGFWDGSISVDSGASIRVELGRAIAFDTPSWRALITPYLFGAAGRGQLHAPTALEQEFTNAQSVGGGVRAQTEDAGDLPGSLLQFEVARRFTDDPYVSEGTRASVSAAVRF